MTTSRHALRILAQAAAVSACVLGCTPKAPDGMAPSPSIAAADARPATTPNAKPQAIGARSLGALPLAFERNDASAGYVSRSPRYTVHVTPAQTVLAIRGDVATARGSAAKPSTGAALHTRLVGARADVDLTASEQLPGKANYLVGNDPTRWRRDVPLFGKVRARDAYPGIDVVYYGNGTQLEHDFVVAPGADPSRIRIAYAGQSGPLRIDAHGALVVPMPGGDVIQRAPVTYQERAGRREPIAARYELHDVGASQEVGFAVASYDPTRTLVIDPILVYSTYLGGSSNDGYGSVALAVDASGSAYMTGVASSTDFPMQAPFQATSAAGDAFITKFTPDGSALVYSTYLGGSGVDFGIAIAIDGAGSAYVFGLTLSTDFPTQSPIQPTFGGMQDNFVAKLSPAGDALVYSTYLGGNEFEYNIGGIAVDSIGGAWVAGTTESTNFPIQAPLQATLRGGADVFVARLSPSGTSMTFSTYFGGTAPDASEVATGIAVDAADFPVVTGYTDSLDFPHFGGSACPASSVCAFVTRFWPYGSVSNSRFLHGSTPNTFSHGEAIAIDGAGDVYITGITNALDFPTTPGAFQTTPGSAFVAKLRSTLVGGPIYSTYLPAATPRGIAVDRAGGAWVTGGVYTGLPTVSPIQSMPAGGGDAFVARLTPSGSALSFSTYLGGTDWDGGLAIAVRPAPGAGGSFTVAYVAGDTKSTDFPTHLPYETSPGDGDLYDAFLAKVGAGLVETQQAVSAGGTVSTNPHPVAELSVTSPNAGNVSIVGGLAIGAPGGGIEFDVTAPTATAANPLVLRFVVHGPNAPTYAAAIRNLSRVPPCTGAPGTASPDPCVASTTTLMNGDLEIVVDTSAASLWTIADTATTPVCPQSPAPGCQAAQSTKSALQVVRKPDDRKDKLTWKWTSSATVDAADFGAPESTTGYQLCLYTQGALRAGDLMPAGGTCAGRPCWRLTPTGHGYADKELTPLGISKLTLRAGGPGKAKLAVSGKGAHLADTPLPLALPARVQLIRIDDGTCWEATYSAASTATGEVFKALSD